MNALEKLIARDEIRQLAHRYAVYVDARDFDPLMELYTEDVRASRGRRGRDALRREFEEMMRSLGLSFLHVGNHVIDFEDETHAKGIVYCRAEIQDGGLDSKRWVVQAIQYHDDSECRDGRWLFARRRHLLVYGAELGQNPLGLPPAHWPESQTGTGVVPWSLESWKRFWATDAADPGA
jgi:ketosteroid isomerase-like protein